MGAVIIPVLLSFFLGPGVGQLYNRDYKKGALLIIGSAVVLIWAGVWYFHAVRPFIPTDITTIDPQALTELTKHAAEQVAQQSGGTLLLFKGMLIGLWIYGVGDAYLVADRKRRTSHGNGSSAHPAGIGTGKVDDGQTKGN